MKTSCIYHDRRNWFVAKVQKLSVSATKDSKLVPNTISTSAPSFMIDAIIWHTICFTFASGYKPEDADAR